MAIRMSVLCGCLTVNVDIYQTVVSDVHFGLKTFDYDWAFEWDECATKFFGDALIYDGTGSTRVELGDSVHLACGGGDVTVNHAEIGVGGKLDVAFGYAGGSHWG